MNAPAISDVVPFWETAGRRVGASLDEITAVAVIGDDLHATASVALGLALEQGLRRRVALADLLDDAHAFAKYGGGDGHGISDTILYGVSIEKIAQPMAESANLRFLPPGLDSPLTSEVLESAQWRGVIDRVRRADAMLVLALPSGLEAANTLLAQLDGVVLVGGAVRPQPASHVLGEVRSPARQAGRRASKLRSAEVVAPRSRRWAVTGALIAAGLALAIVATRWSQQRAVAPDLVSTVSSGTAVAPDTVVPIIAPDDASWGVEVASLNTERGAADRVRSAGDTIPAATYSPMQFGDSGTRWFTIVVGAYRERGSADSLLASLTARGAVSQGTVVRMPWSLALDTLSALDSARGRIAALRARGVPAYGLLQADGRVRLYAGAFQSPEHGTLLRDILRYVNINSTMVPRVGRVF